MTHSHKQRFLRLILCLSLALVLLATLSIVPHKTAHALAASYRAPCSGASCNGRNPYTYTGSTGYPCAGVSGANWYVVASAPLLIEDGSNTQVGYLQVWYSGSCNVNWGRIVANPYDGITDIGLWVASLYDENVHGNHWNPTQSGSYQYCNEYNNGDCGNWYSTNGVDQISNMDEIDDNACFYAEERYGMAGFAQGWACQ